MIRASLRRRRFTACLPNYSNDEAILTQLRDGPDRMWRPVELVDRAAAHGTPSFPPGRGFAYTDTGYVITGINVHLHH